MFEKFTDEARHAVVLAQEGARLLRHDYIGTEHLLPALVPEGWATTYGHIPFTPEAKRAFEGALDESRRRGNQHVGTAHLLLSLLREPSGRVAAAGAVLSLPAGAVRRPVVGRGQSAGVVRHRPRDGPATHHRDRHRRHDRRAPAGLRPRRPRSTCVGPARQ
ncbi:MAG: Clp protease N-terminal domain-containing protein [Acidimicrobiales bacterium]